MNIDFKNVRLESTIFDSKKLILENLPSIAFIGRSNVGKSSLLNTLVDSKKIAKVSQSPGKTRSINYFNVDNKLYFVDLPGYGYSKAGKSETERFGKLLEKFFLSNNKLILVCHLIDSRHEPTQLDQIANNFLMNLNIPYCILFTKVDKLKQSQRAKLLNCSKEFIKSKQSIVIIPFSSKSGEGKNELLSHIKSVYKKSIAYKLMQNQIRS